MWIKKIDLTEEILNWKIVEWNENINQNNEEELVTIKIKGDTKEILDIIKEMKQLEIWEENEEEVYDSIIKLLIANLIEEWNEDENEDENE